jgi:SAM-dependent methyltransferase
MAVMLEQLEAGCDQRVLEIGTGTGYSAALLAHLVGETGQVITMDIDENLVEQARRNLAATNVGGVSVGEPASRSCSAVSGCLENELDHATMGAKLPPRTAGPHLNLEPTPPAPRPSRVRIVLQLPSAASGHREHPTAASVALTLTMKRARCFTGDLVTRPGLLRL